MFQVWVNDIVRIKGSVVLSIMHYKVAVTFPTFDEILECNLLK